MLLPLILLCLPGCSVWRQVYWTLSEEAAYRRSERDIVRREIALAETAWCEFARISPSLSRSEFFGEGFRDGFAGFLHTGFVDPPVAPPERYLHISGVEGVAATKDWFAGYQQGAAAAMASGARENEIVPLWAARPCPPWRPPMGPPPSGPSPGRPGTVIPLPVEELLPGEPLSRR